MILQLQDCFLIALMNETSLYDSFSYADAFVSH